jgi:WD40 repeat protein
MYIASCRLRSVGWLVLAVAFRLGAVSAAAQPASEPHPVLTSQESEDRRAAADMAQPELVLQRGHSHPVNALSFSPDGKTLAVGSGDHRVHLWDTATGLIRRTLPGQRSTGKSIAFSPDGRWLATLGFDRVSVWDTSGWQARAFQSGEVAVRDISVLAWSTDSRTLAAVEGPKAHLWDVATGKVRQTLKGDVGGVKALAYDPTGALLAGGGYNSFVHFWDAASGELQFETRLTGRITDLAYSPSTLTLAVAAGKTVWLYNSRTFKAIETGEPVTSLAFSPDGKTLATASPRLLRLWDAATGEEEARHEDRYSPNALAYSPDGATLAVSWGPTVRFMDPNTLETNRELPVAKDAWTVAALSPEGDRLAISTRDNSGRSVLIWDIREARVVHTFRVPAIFSALAWSPDGLTLASVREGSTGSVELWRVEPNAPSDSSLRTCHGHENAGWVGSRRIVFSPDGRLLAAGTSKRVFLWDTSTGQLVRTLEGHLDYVGALAFTPDGKTLACGSIGIGVLQYQGEIKLWDVATGELRRMWGQQEGGAFGRAIAISPDGRLLAVAGQLISEWRFQSVVRLWDVASGIRKYTFLVQAVSAGDSGGRDIRRLTFSPDGRTLAAGHNDGTLQLWTVEGTPSEKRSVVRTAAQSPLGSQSASVAIP